MTSSLALRARGLVDSHDIAERPGGLTVARNVVIEPGGSIITRPSFSEEVDPTGITELPRTLMIYGGSWATVGDDAGTYRVRTVDGPVSGACQQPSDMLGPEHPWTSARGSLLIGSDKGWRKLTSRSDTTLEDAGIDFEISYNPLIIFGSSGVADNAPQFTGLVAYRMVVVRKDPNGYVIRSRPTTRFVTDGNVIGGSASLLGGAARYYFTGLREGDVVEWYRTRGSGSSSVPPASSAYLVATYTITSGDVALGYFANPNTYDRLSDDELGAALYTNPEREGIEKQKYQPPIARSAATFARCTWYGDTTSQHRIVSSLRSVGTVIDFFGDLTTGSNLITNVPSVTGLAVGQYVCDSATTPRVNGTSILAMTRITAISAGPAPYTVTMSQNATGSATTAGLGACNWSEPSLVARDARGDFTSGTNTIVNIPNVTGMYAGMYVSDSADGPTVAGPLIPAETKITSIVGTGPYAVTLDKNLTGTTFGGTFFVHDWIKIAGRDYYADSAARWYAPGTGYSTQRRMFPCGTSSFDTVGAVVRILSLTVAHELNLNASGVRLIGTGSENAFGALTTGDFTIEEVGLGGAPFTLEGNTSSQSVDAFWPPLRSAITSSNDRATNRIAWSAPDEPEAVPLPNFVDIATSSARVLRMVPLRTSMLVFTTEGLYRVSGVAPDAWATDLIDPSLVLLNRECADVVDNVCYALTTRGLVAVDETGFTDVSSGAVGRTLERYASVDSSAGVQWVKAWKAQGLVLVGCADGQDPNWQTTTVLVYSTRSRAWSEWPLNRWRIGGDTGRFFFAARGDRYGIYGSGGSLVGYDTTHAVGSFSHTSGTTTVTIPALDLSGWEPKSGDYVAINDGFDVLWRRVVSVTPGSSYTITLSRPTTSGASYVGLIGYSVAVVDVEWAPMSAGAVPGAHSRWRDAVVTLDVSRFLDVQIFGDGDAQAPPEIEPGFGASTSMVEETLNRKLIEIPRTRDLPIRFAFPRRVSRASIIRPRYKCSTVGWVPRIMAISTSRTDANERVRR